MHIQYEVHLILPQYLAVDVAHVCPFVVRRPPPAVGRKVLRRWRTLPLGSLWSVLGLARDTLARFVSLPNPPEGYRDGQIATMIRKQCVTS